MGTCIECGCFANANVYKVRNRHNALGTDAFAAYSALEFGPAQLRLWSREHHVSMSQGGCLGRKVTLCTKQLL